MTTLSEDIRAHARRTALPWGGDGEVIAPADIRTISVNRSRPGHLVESEALRLSIIPLRYLRNMQTIPAQGQIQLLESTVAQIGLGGLGGTLLEQFLRAGIGTIRGADGDDFEDSNLNRQALAEAGTIGTAKTHAALTRSKAINPSVDLIPCSDYLTPDSLPDFLKGCDVAVDALGGLETRRHLQHAATETAIPLVTGALAGWTGYVSVVMPGEIGPADLMGVNNAAEESLGCPAPAVGFIASLMATEVIRLITEGSSPLAGKIMVIDLNTLTFEKVTLS